jgi:acid phosphatase
MQSALVSLLIAANAVGVYAGSSSFDPLRHLAGIAPYFEDPQADPKPPQGCNVTRASYLIRHAAIYANDFDYEEYIEPFTDKLKNTTANWRSAGPLDFLAKWQSPITDEELEDLTTIGRLESYKLGVDVRLRYPSFKDPKHVWTSTAERTELSTSSFIDGLVADSNNTKLVPVREDAARGADSLTPYKGCPKYSSSFGSKQSSEYQKIYTKPIIDRLNTYAPNFNFTASDVVGMQQLCGYETVIRGSSPFCDLDLFSQDEWLSFEYMNDIMYFYNTGYGSEQLAGTLGLPWLNASAELLLSDEADQDLYVSFTHRELPPTVAVAMGLFNNSLYSGANNPNATMPLNRQNRGRVWRSSRILPFLSNFAIEKMTCDSYGFDAGDYFRVLVNKDPQQLSCTDGPGESCSKSAFEGFIQEKKTRFGGFTEFCEPEYKNSTDALTIYSGDN